MRVARHTQQDERDGHHAHAQPLTPAQAESEVSLGEHGEQDEPAGQHRLGQRQREQRQRRDVREERDDGDGPPDGPPLRPEEVDGAAQRMAGVDVWCRDGPPVLEEEAQVRAKRGQDRAEQSHPVGEREPVDLNSDRRAALSLTLLLASSAGGP